MLLDRDIYPEPTRAMVIGVASGCGLDKCGDLLYSESTHAMGMGVTSGCGLNKCGFGYVSVNEKIMK